MNGCVVYLRQIMHICGTHVLPALEPKSIQLPACSGQLVMELS